jgi:hypothetical protein
MQGRPVSLPLLYLPAEVARILRVSPGRVRGLI